MIGQPCGKRCLAGDILPCTRREHVPKNHIINKRIWRIRAYDHLARDDGAESSDMHSRKRTLERTDWRPRRTYNYCISHSEPP
jgi:hypothetical protein